MSTASESASRDAYLARGLQLEYLTVGWNVVEGVVAVSAALAAGSIALLGFGIDSFVETASGAILIWRLRAERTAGDYAAVERLDARAHKLVGLSLFVLAAYVAFEALRGLIAGERPEPSWVGIAVTSVSFAVMWWLAREKRVAAAALESRALKADAFQTTACFWLSLITLAGVGLNAALGWWWADPAAALAMTYFIAAEGREARRGMLRLKRARISASMRAALRIELSRESGRMARCRAART
ncbi:MAG: cation diffusion facilitator family transporter [Candidatus Binataceae bacterium]